MRGLRRPGRRGCRPAALPHPPPGSPRSRRPPARARSTGGLQRRSPSARKGHLMTAPPLRRVSEASLHRADCDDGDRAGGAQRAPSCHRRRPCAGARHARPAAAGPPEGRPQFPAARHDDLCRAPPKVVRISSTWRGSGGSATCGGAVGSEADKPQGEGRLQAPGVTHGDRLLPGDVDPLAEIAGEELLDQREPRDRRQACGGLEPWAAVPWFPAPPEPPSFCAPAAARGTRPPRDGPVPVRGVTPGA